MGKWHPLLWISALYLLTACSSGPLSSERSSTQEKAPTPTESTQESTPSQSNKPSAEQAQSTQPLTEQSGESLSAPSQPVPSTTASPQAALEDKTVIPGERVGPITFETSRADLVKMFGEGALEDSEIDVGEGFTELGTTVNAGSEQAFSVIWMDENQTRVTEVREFGPAWHTPEGLGVGSSLADLKAVLGSFSLFGFAWDYEGTVVLDESNLAQYSGPLILRLQPNPTAIGKSPEAYQAVMGDKILSSADPNLSSLDLAVYEMIVHLDPPAQ